MGESLVTAFAVAALVAGCALVAFIGTTALRGALGRTWPALGASAALMALLFTVIGGSPASVLLLVALAHGIAGGVIWLRARGAGR
jgi:hypothetical protein